MRTGKFTFLWVHGACICVVKSTSKPSRAGRYRDRRIHGPRGAFYLQRSSMQRKASRPGLFDEQCVGHQNQTSVSTPNLLLPLSLQTIVDGVMHRDFLLKYQELYFPALQPLSQSVHQESQRHIFWRLRIYSLTLVLVEVGMT